MASDPYAALEVANSVRSARSLFKRLIRESPWSLVELLRSGEFPDEVVRMKVWDALVALPGAGGPASRFARGLLRRVRIDDQRTLGALTERQRCELADALEAFSVKHNGDVRLGWER